ncbi:MAG: 4-hydroxy-3-methylbut-2-enyl diphosphate reductase [Lachnospiraceae bacterium]|jgi:4-hydroxy-3-methylbut-2-enyl diphosphate reductase|nr:4-hydroxy-3-methylbut-2-enyl diphosphate reductase [Lachnospiraceae bacterium]MDD4524260.1 4-hydroxy-3-methylbut-2-enyl diphosphate reductase [Lachnospiraceae bacterium]
MEIITAKTAGFCFGVQKAVDLVYELVDKAGSEGSGVIGPIYTYGPIIHNETVVEDLERKGVKVINTPEEIDRIKSGTIVIRSHGVSKELAERAASCGAVCQDATCPFVQRIHRIVEEESDGGAQIIIIGNAGHPEVVGIMGWSSTPAVVIENEEEAESYSGDPEKPVCIVSQTTFNVIKFNELVAILKSRLYNVNVVNTICNATRERQEEARSIASDADVMIVIGGKTSSNSAKLYEICGKECANTFFIQTVDDLHLNLSGKEKVIGITAGASTPKNIIEEVQNYVRTGREF